MVLAGSGEHASHHRTARATCLAGLVVDLKALPIASERLSQLLPDAVQGPRRAERLTSQAQQLQAMPKQARLHGRLCSVQLSCGLTCCRAVAPWPSQRRSRARPPAPPPRPAHGERADTKHMRAVLVAWWGRGCAECGVRLRSCSSAPGTRQQEGRLAPVQRIYTSPAAPSSSAAAGLPALARGSCERPRSTARAPAPGCHTLQGWREGLWHVPLVTWVAW